ncbi:phage holin family protein [Virgibacillus pantothenticus]|uniref:phage holin family protein n=1 Tax=Virgibacillus pantothenticus TaxID=1473 RepID=UPI001C25035C|nr:phage holin family protein [Virgibacillus pantothenticus]MBU8567596.1 phage holin family protein [Virgibacillus pantothenticus]MBU8601384.1 phage holin family protein [Virgibacillus pantothenticus]MBU8636201.1 phage holin family protein [Virgibacillus pantothenticus]MBU8643721.1 phage holin family protein [Virgibacillus pantothenticus]MBU8648023.1 phage holin family protein [Virgibacillus pantothenticus]
MESIFKIIVAAGGGLASFLYGGWSAMLNILLAFVVIDYATGLIAAGTTGKLNSGVGFKGIAKKVAIFFVVAVAHMVDVALGADTHMFRDAAIFFYLANELLSITENSGKIGIPIPDKLLNAVEVLKGKKDR